MISSIIWWLIIGAVAGWAAGQFMRGGGFGLVGNIIVGIVGAVIGGFLFNLLGMSSTNIIGSLVTAIVGAVVLLYVAGLLNRS
ncbi:MAG: GlsB/YeaQ/YmgE family stress response membrane protein [Caldilineaceae bacterium]|nr:GlsB/YeaQ/YmgE family stress response membrane protein [Caldilineaceae bacterium]MCB9137968.1 GlsB/YeaQ/YmgE family stress response membrane protein [Caldilineaceae bacterium]